MTVEFWKNKWGEQQENLNELREENLILTKVVHDAAQHVQNTMTQEPSTVANSETNLHNSRHVQSKFDQSVKNFKTHADTMRDLSIPFKGLGKEEEGEDLIYRAKQNIRTNSQLPSILAA